MTKQMTITFKHQERLLKNIMWGGGDDSFRPKQISRDWAKCSQYNESLDVDLVLLQN